MEFVVYILYSKSYDKIYVGYTSDLIHRFISHNSLAKKGWTIRYRPWEVIFCEFFQDKKHAAVREKLMKGALARKWIREKISSEYKSVGFISA